MNATLSDSLASQIRSLRQSNIKLRADRNSLYEALNECDQHFVRTGAQHGIAQRTRAALERLEQRTW